MIGPEILFPNRDVPKFRLPVLPPNRILEGLGFENSELLPNNEEEGVILENSPPFGSVLFELSKSDPDTGSLAGSFDTLSLNSSFLGGVGFDRMLLKSPTPCDWLKRLSLKGFLSN